jgi:glycerate 2-kinase
MVCTMPGMPRPKFEDHRKHMDAIIRAVLDACEPAACVRRSLREHPCGFELPAVVAIGKAAAGMFRGWVDERGEPAHRLLVVPEGTKGAGDAMRAEHPLPGEGSLAAGLALERFVRERVSRKDCDGLVVLLSGGASSLVVRPIEPLTVETYREVVNRMLRAGADIRALNTVRKHIDVLKGGRLAVLAHPLPIDARVISDVIGDDPSIVASGPVSPDPSTSEQAAAVLERFGLKAPMVREVLRSNASETPKPGDSAFAKVVLLFVASNGTALVAAREAAMGIGFERVSVTPGLIGEASEAGRRIAEDARSAQRPSARLWGGETTVTVGRTGGLGGRNQEMALSALISIDGCPRVAIACFASDGVDGPTGAAGAVLTGRTHAQAVAVGLDPAAALARHDSHGFFRGLGEAGEGCLLTPGATGTNVNDLGIALCY